MSTSVASAPSLAPKTSSRRMCYEQIRREPVRVFVGEAYGGCEHRETAVRGRLARAVLGARRHASGGRAMSTSVASARPLRARVGGPPNGRWASTTPGTGETFLGPLLPAAIAGRESPASRIREYRRPLPGRGRRPCAGAPRPSERGRRSRRWVPKTPRSEAIAFRQRLRQSVGLPRPGHCRP